MPSSRPSPIIELGAVEKTYTLRRQAVRALRSVTLSIEAGESLAVVGPSGSGKSTLLHVLSGLDTIDAGRVRVLGEELRTLSDSARADFRNRSLGFIFQDFHLVQQFSALQNVQLPLQLRHPRVPRAEAISAARDALREVGLGDRTHHRPAELSGGEQQRVAIARAIVGEPRILVADEPTGNLDQATGRAVITLLKALMKRSGTTLVLATHDPELARLCDRTVHMVDGRLTPAPA